jgi:hypothetical protein
LALSLAVATRTANGSAPIAVTALIALSTRRPAGDVQRRRPRTRPT